MNSCKYFIQQFSYYSGGKQVAEAEAFCGTALDFLFI